MSEMPSNKENSIELKHVKLPPVLKDIKSEVVLTEAQLQELENKATFKLKPDLREFLKYYSGVYFQRRMNKHLPYLDFVIPNRHGMKIIRGGLAGVNKIDESGDFHLGLFDYDLAGTRKPILTFGSHAALHYLFVSESGDIWYAYVREFDEDGKKYIKVANSFNDFLTILQIRKDFIDSFLKEYPERQADIQWMIDEENGIFNDEEEDEDEDY